jgi:hypothetical protein
MYNVINRELDSKIRASPLGGVSREMVKWRRYINHNKQKQLWDLTFVTVRSSALKWRQRD